MGDETDVVQAFTMEELLKLFARTILFLLDDETGISVKNESDGQCYVVFRNGSYINVTDKAQDVPEGLKVKISKE